METENLFKEVGSFKGYKSLPEDATRRVIIQESGIAKLDINISLATLSVESSGVNEENVYEWLWDKGMEFLDSHNVELTKLLITSTMVSNGKLLVPWESIIQKPK